MKRYRPATPYLYILPHLTCYVVFIMIPFGCGLYMSMHRWSIVKGNGGFVGFKYFARLLDFDFERGRQYWRALWVTFQFMLFYIPPMLLLSLGLALLINAHRRKLAQAVFQFSMLVPTAIAVSVVAVIWRWLLSYDAGLVNYVLTLLNISRKPWLVDLPWVWISVVLPTLWMGMGWNMMLFLVGIRNISPQLYEAASVDGAGPWQRFRHVTLPGLRPVTVFILISQFIGAFSLFAQPQLLTQGGPGRATTPIMLFLYTEAFNPNYPRMGSSIAMGFVTGGIVFLCVSLIYKIFNKPTDR